MTGWLIAVIYGVRALLGSLFQIGPFWLNISAGILAGAQSLISAVLSRGSAKVRITKETQNLIDLASWVLLSAFFGLDASFSGASSFSPWALLIVAPIILNPCEAGPFSLFAAVLPAALGIADAAGAFSGGSPRYGVFISVLAGFALGSVARIKGLNRRAELDRVLAHQQDRERKILQLKDAEVEIAARIQRTLLVDQTEEGPKDIKLDAITVASNAVDGDFYGLIPYSSNEIDVLVGDVMGKGVPAALVGAALKGAFLRQALRLIVEYQGRLPTPGELVTAVHYAIVDQLMDLDRFATLQYIRFNTKKLTMTYVDCGHTPFIHYDASLGVCWVLKGTNLPIGFTDEQVYHPYEIPLFPADRLLFYSDGISEASNEKKELFGEWRLADILRQNAYLEPRELLRRILNTAMFFASTEGFRDDVTCIAVAIEPAAKSEIRKSRDFSCEPQSLAGVRSFINLVLPENLETSRKTAITESVLEATERVLQHLGGSKTDKLKPVMAAWEEAGELCAGAVYEKGAQETTDKLPAEADELEELLEQDPLPTLLAYRLEYRSTDSWISIRILYHGAALPQQRGKALDICKAHKPDSVYVAQGQDNLALVGLVFHN